MHQADNLSEIAISSLYLASPMYQRIEYKVYLPKHLLFNILKDSRLLEVSCILPCAVPWQIQSPVEQYFPSTDI